MRQFLITGYISLLLLLSGCMGDNVNSSDLTQDSIKNSYQWVEIKAMEEGNVLEYRAALRQNGYYNTWINFLPNEFFYVSSRSFSKQLTKTEFVEHGVSFYTEKDFFTTADSFVDYNFTLQYKSRFFSNTIKSPYIYSIKEVNCNRRAPIACTINTDYKSNQQTKDNNYQYVIYEFKDNNYIDVGYSPAIWNTNTTDKVKFDYLNKLSSNNYYVRLEIRNSNEFQRDNNSPHTWTVYDFKSKLIKVNFID